MSKMSSGELFERYENAFSAQVELEAEMWRFVETAEDRGEAEKKVMEKGGLVDKINAARAEADQAWKKYSDALRKECDEENLLARMRAELDLA